MFDNIKSNFKSSGNMCYDLGYITEDVLNYVEPKVTEIQKQLTGLIRSVK